jgi:hypothetical protein
MTAVVSAAGARPAATKPMAASKVMSKVARMSDVSPISDPLNTLLQALFQQPRVKGWLTPRI